MMWKGALLSALILANAYVWTLSPPAGLTVSFLNVGEGDAVFLQAFDASILIDGGPVGSGVLREIGSRLPFFDRTLDAVIETTPTASESGGLIGVFDRYRVRAFFTSPVPGDTKTTQILSHSAQEEGAKVAALSRGARVLFGNGAYADVLSPQANTQKLNANSGALVLRVVYGKTSFLLLSGTSEKEETALVALDGAALKSDVVKAGQHGSKNASSPIFAAAASARYAIFSRGCDNRFGHPAPEAVAAFQNTGATIFDTCVNGTITFTSDGRALSVE